MFEKYFETYKNEVHAAITSYLLWKTIQNRASEKKEILAALNISPLSWNVISHSLQVTAFITLGRIFDSSEKSVSVHSLIQTCIDEIDIFSLEKLRERKSQALTGKALDDYIENAQSPDVEFFESLRDKLSEQYTLYKDVYRPIRHKTMAHKDKEYLEDDTELWKSTKIGDVENILWILDSFENLLFDLYHNGRIRELSADQLDLSFYEKDFDKLIANVST